MTDIVPPETRSRMMAGIRGKNTAPELAVRRALFAAGLRFRLHRKDLPGKPDIVLPARKVAIFVHGCFWHQHAGCPYAKMPTSNREFWAKKLLANVERDQKAVHELRMAGWRVLTVWECSIRNKESESSLRAALRAWIDRESGYGEL
ncbi:DNA mismatch endonuclease Vsr [Aromatoleum evansii]|uniref:DNA mismatch endonuclease Vsr n=1 Tax=Aromatoleum evansii TaxID=59406 RepID=UPI00145F2CF2|nr:DNA mismatch endonuclease Vsr [Aromatoleum evansii]